MNASRADTRDSALPHGRALAVEVARLVEPWRAHLVFAIVLIVASALVELVPPFVIRAVIDQDLIPRRTDGLVSAGILYLGAVALDAAFSFGYGYLAALIAQRALAALRVRLFAHLSRLPISFFDRTPLGDVISRVTADVDTIDEVFTGGIAALIGQLVPLIAVVVAMVVISPQLSLIAALVAPPLLAISRFIQLRVREAQRRTRRAIGQVNAELAEDVSSILTIRAFAREDLFVARFRVALTAMLRAANRSTYFNGLYAPLTGLLASLVTAALIWAGSPRSLVGAGVEFGTLTAFILLFQRFFSPIIAVGDEWQSVQAAIAGAERVFELLHVPAETAPAGMERPGVAGRDDRGIRVTDVTFGYRADRPVLRGFSLSVAPGEHVAVVGRTGAGKSTLVSLLAGLYAPDRGTIRVAGREPLALDDTDRRRIVGVVPQTVQLFAGTLRDNLTLDDPSISAEACARAARVSGLDTLVPALPEGFDTMLAADRGGSGIALSAGQRQLVALTRALVAEPVVLLLDEATAAIDGASDAAFRAALRRVSEERGQAVLTVAHRLSTARDADRVVVMEHGQIVEEGPPTELAASGGRFSALLELEAAGWDWRDAEPAELTT